MMQYEEPNEKLADTSACAGVRADLKMCLLQSDCCKVVSYFESQIMSVSDLLLVYILA